MKCPDCGGAGGSIAFINTGPDISGHHMARVECMFCAGCGQATPGMVAQREAGRSWVDAQLDAGSRLLDVAKAWGLTTSQVSEIRQGRIPIPARQQEPRHD